ILDANADEIGQIEKSSIVDLLAGDAPVRQAVPLRVEQRIEIVEAFRKSRLAVESPDGALERVPKVGILLVDAPDRLLEEFAVRDRLLSLDQLPQLDGHALRRQRVDTFAQDDAIRLRRERQAMLVVQEMEAVAIESELDLLRLDGLAVRAAQDRK